MEHCRIPVEVGPAGISRCEGTSDATVAGLRAKNDAARFALKDDNTGIGWHLHFCYTPIVRVCHDRLCDNAAFLL